MYAGLVKPMVEYDRKIRYLDYIENGQRCQGAGFVKLERRDGLCNISLQISGVYRRDRFTRPFLLLTEKGEKELCKLQFADGGIKTCFEGLDSGNLGGQGIGYSQVYGIKIPISDGKEIRCIWRHMETEAVSGQQAEAEVVQKLEAQAEAEAVQKSVQAEAADAVQKPGTWAEADAVQRLGVQAEAADAVQKPEPQAEAEAVQKPEAQADFAQMKSQFGGSTQEKTAAVSQRSGTCAQGEKFVFKEDKWEQLWTIYPHVHPFGDQREYLSIGPSDFVLLAMKSYRLVNNSFLLHGYYNYQHLILMKGGRQGQPRFYIGVPGNLYEREKRTALMFGFEGFECNREPAEEGDFGYFLIPVEL